MANTLTTNEGEVRERVTGGAEAFAGLEDALLGPLMGKVGEMTREYMPENDPPLNAPISGITPAMIDAGAKMTVEVFHDKVTEEDARLWVGEIYAAMRVMRPVEREATQAMVNEARPHLYDYTIRVEDFDYPSPARDAFIDRTLAAIYRAMRAMAPR